jgi:LPS export ABC transporter protein LptC
VIRRQTRRGIILLTLLAVLSWILTRPGDEERLEPVAGLDTRLNYALHDFRGRLLDSEGQISLEIEAPLLRNDAATGVGTVEQPNIRIQQEHEEWYITAELAVIASDREQVNLLGKVNLLRRNEITGDLLDIRTSDVLLHVTPRTASTEADVEIRQAGDRVDATGMRLDMINDRVELLNEVQAHYEVL